MEVSLRDASLLNIFRVLGLIVRVRVQGLVGNHVVLEQRLQVCLAVFAEEESVDPGAELLEGEVGGGKEGTSDVIGGVVDGLEETSLLETKLEGAELAR